MRRGVLAVVVLGQFSLTATARNQRQLCGAAGYSRFRPSADVRPRGLSDRTRQEAVGHLRAGAERQSRNNRVLVSSRSCGPAIDPLQPAAVLSASDRCTSEPDVRSRRRETKPRRQRSFERGEHRAPKDDPANNCIRRPCTHAVARDRPRCSAR